MMADSAGIERRTKSHSKSQRVQGARREGGIKGQVGGAKGGGSGVKPQYPQR